MNRESAQATAVSPKVRARKLTLALTGVGVFIFFWTLFPNGHWPAASGNFIGALLVAAGGLLATLNALEVGREKINPWSYSFIVVGGFAIAGAALQSIIWPPTCAC
ncbi:hypothetical protein [Paenarthrobacter sp. TA1.8]|uniref:hypothetical protein n=1 Tax=Paenarthrobacter sp. TA1.8 TaxID=3400219 RepID=UPI003B4280BE